MHTTSKVILSIRDISKIYYTKERAVHALDGITIDIHEGEIFALLGVNGAGKSTLSSIIATLHPPTRGDILFEGTSIYTHDHMRRYRASLGFCPQHPNLDGYLTVRENLIYAGRYFGLEEAYILERSAQLLEKFALTKYADFKINALSGGYRQRLSIARALMHNSRIIILDEPTVGLDPNIRRQLWAIIKELKTQGITVVLTTHYLDEAEVLSDRVCVLSKGKIILTRTVDELKKMHDAKTLEEAFLRLTAEEEEL